MIIIGAGEAGGCAAVAMREAGWDGPITIIGEERHRPYERPPLSKALLTNGEVPRPRLSAEAERLDALDIRHRPNSRVVQLDRSRHQIRLQSGEVLP